MESSIGSAPINCEFVLSSSSFFSQSRDSPLQSFAAKRHQEFVGHGQHDAQELLTILLDALHEVREHTRLLLSHDDVHLGSQSSDDQTASPTRRRSGPNRSGRDHRLDFPAPIAFLQIVADEYWRGYLSRNDSIIVELFTGQFKSKTKCPQCHRVRVTLVPKPSLLIIHCRNQSPSIPSPRSLYPCLNAPPSTPSSPTETMTDHRRSSASSCPRMDPSLNSNSSSSLNVVYPRTRCVARLNAAITA